MEVKEAFRETAASWGLAVAVLVAFIVLIVFGVWRVWVWVKPHIESYFESTLKTQAALRKKARIDSRTLRLQGENIEKLTDGMDSLRASMESMTKLAENFICRAHHEKEGK